MNDTTSFVKTVSKILPWRWYWKLFLLVVGSASTAAEMVGLRLLAPLFGSSLPVWGAGIAVVIAGLALGYHWAGKRASSSVTYQTVFMQAALAAATFLMLPIAMQLAQMLQALFLSTGLILVGLGSVFVAYVILLPPAILFGMVGPLAIQAQTREKRAAGATAGAVFSLTTFGSLIGILLPSFITIPLLGTNQTVWIFAGAVLILSSPAVIKNTRGLFMMSALALLIGGAPYLLQSADPSVIFQTDSAYQYIEVRQDASGFRQLIFDAGLGVQSVLSPELYTNSYWDYPAALPVWIPTDRSELKVLVLGAAASTSERQLDRFWSGHRMFDFTSVEIDGQVPIIAERFFDPPQRKVVIADARAHVRADKSKYQLIIVDAYSKELTVPFHLATEEFFRLLSERMTVDGIIAINTNAIDEDALFIRSLSRTMRQVFPHVYLINVPDSCNMLLLARKQPLPNEYVQPIPEAIRPLLPVLAQVHTPRSDGILFTDNRAPTDLLGLSALIQLADTPDACRKKETT